MILAETNTYGVSISPVNDMLTGDTFNSYIQELIKMWLKEMTQAGSFYTFLNKETINLWLSNKTNKFGLVVVNYWESAKFRSFFGAEFPISGDEHL